MKDKDLLISSNGNKEFLWITLSEDFKCCPVVLRERKKTSERTHIAKQ